MRSKNSNYQRQAIRSVKNGTAEQAERITRGLSHSAMATRINSQNRKQIKSATCDELRLAAIDLCNRNDQLEHVLRKMLGTVQVGLARGEIGADTLQSLYET